MSYKQKSLFKKITKPSKNKNDQIKNYKPFKFEPVDDRHLKIPKCKFLIH